MVEGGYGSVGRNLDHNVAVRRGRVGIQLAFKAVLKAVAIGNTIETAFDSDRETVPADARHSWSNRLLDFRQSGG